MVTRPDAIALLKEDHRAVEDLFARFEAAATMKQQLSIATKICDALRLHGEIEEGIFYPAMRAAISETELIDEAEVEHQSVKFLIAQIETGDLSSDMFRANVMVLKEYVEHHVAEEEGEMFPKAKSAKMDLKGLAEAMEAAKSERV